MTQACNEYAQTERYKQKAEEVKKMSVKVMVCFMYNEIEYTIK